ncbi:MAG: sugar-binding protein [bacterium]
MKPFLAAAATALVLYGTCVTGAVINVPKTTDPVTIDGTINPTEWSKAAVVTSASFSMLNAWPDPAVPWAVANKCYIMWDDNNLYVAFDVHDIYLTAADTGWWNDDYTWISLDRNGEGGAYAMTDDYYIATSFRDLAFPSIPKELEQVIWPRVGNGVAYGAWQVWSPTGLNWAWHTMGTINDNLDIDTGYTFELAIPWSQVVGGAPSIGQPCRFEFNVVDNPPSPTWYNVLTGPMPMVWDAILHAPDNWQQGVFTGSSTAVDEWQLYQ